MLGLRRHRRSSYSATSIKSDDDSLRSKSVVEDDGATADSSTHHQERRWTKSLLRDPHEAPAQVPSSHPPPLPANAFAQIATARSASSWKGGVTGSSSSKETQSFRSTGTAPFIPPPQSMQYRNNAADYIVEEEVYLPPSNNIHLYVKPDMMDAQPQPRSHRLRYPSSSSSTESSTFDDWTQPAPSNAAQVPTTASMHKPIVPSSDPTEGFPLSKFSWSRRAFRKSSARPPTPPSTVFPSGRMKFEPVEPSDGLANPLVIRSSLSSTSLSTLNNGYTDRLEVAGSAPGMAKDHARTWNWGSATGSTKMMMRRFGGKMGRHESDHVPKNPHRSGVNGDGSPTVYAQEQSIASYTFLRSSTSISSGTPASSIHDGEDEGYCSPRTSEQGSVFGVGAPSGPWSLPQPSNRSDRSMGVSNGSVFSWTVPSMSRFVIFSFKKAPLSPTAYFVLGGSTSLIA
ncbi:hypothetical protein HDU67_008746 [Dinochytrium kinnereticum]|nr:hypothetical protein HDU67_008746 [Dinochytrium kinnereticum]